MDNVSKCGFAIELSAIVALATRGPHVRTTAWTILTRIKTLDEKMELQKMPELVDHIVQALRKNATHVYEIQKFATLLTKEYEEGKKEGKYR